MEGRLMMLMTSLTSLLTRLMPSWTSLITCGTRPANDILFPCWASYSALTIGFTCAWLYGPPYVYVPFVADVTACYSYFPILTLSRFTILTNKPIRKPDEQIGTREVVAPHDICSQHASLVAMFSTRSSILDRMLFVMVIHPCVDSVAPLEVGTSQHYDHMSKR